MMTKTLKRAGHAVIGAPSSLAGSLRERISSMRAAMDDFGGDLSEKARREFDEWAAEGERLVGRLTETMTGWRKEGATRLSEVREKAKTSAETGKDVAAGLRATANEPVLDVELINGIGPGYAKRLRAAAVTTTSALLERCSTAEGLERLAEQADISPNLLVNWVAEADLTRIDGIGSEYREILNAASVATMEQLAEIDPAKIHRRLESLAEVHGWETPLPSESTLGEWRRAASRFERIGS